MTQIILVRHGQTEWNRIERFRGRIDVPLNEFGRKQAESTGRLIAHRWVVMAIYASPLSRAVQTAEAIAQFKVLPVTNCPGLIDLNFGDWQGKTPAEVQLAWPEIYTAWLENPQGVRIPNGETIDELRTRTLKTVIELAGSHSQETIVLVGHKDVNRAILLSALDLNTSQIWQLHQDNCAVNVLQAEGDQITMVSMNETGHLLHV